MSKLTNLGWCLVLLVVCASVGQAEDKKIMLIGTPPDHPYGTHMYLFECQLLAKCLEQTEGIQTTVQQGFPQDDESLQDVDALVFYSRPAGDIVLAPENVDRFMKLMKRGVGYTAIHWATGASPALEPEYKVVLGGWFHRPPCGLNTTRARLLQIDPSHLVCRGWEEYELHEEYYLDLHFHERTVPVLKVVVGDKEQVVAWCFERPDTIEGRSFGTTLGHFHENFTIPQFRKAIVNGILWTAHVEVPSGGAPVELTKEEMTLPPQQQP